MNIKISILKINSFMNEIILKLHYNNHENIWMMEKKLIFFYFQFNSKICIYFLYIIHINKIDRLYNNNNIINRLVINIVVV